MIINVTAKIYNLESKKYIKENNVEQFQVSDPNEATEYSIFKANRYVNMVNGTDKRGHKYLEMADFKVEKYEVNQWLKYMAG